MNFENYRIAQRWQPNNTAFFVFIVFFFHRHLLLMFVVVSISFYCFFALCVLVYFLLIVFSPLSLFCFFLPFLPYLATLHLSVVRIFMWFPSHTPFSFSISCPIVHNNGFLATVFSCLSLYSLFILIHFHICLLSETLFIYFYRCPSFDIGEGP